MTVSLIHTLYESSLAVARLQLPTMHIPQLLYSCPYWLVTASQVTTFFGRSFRLLLAFTSTDIAGFSLLKIRDQEFCSLPDIYV
jgi:hypothetical protein